MKKSRNVIFNQKKVGEVDSEDGVFITKRKPEHYFNKYDGFGISKLIINHLKRLHIKEVRILYGEIKPERWITDLNSFVKYGQTFNHGKDSQLILSKRHWDITKLGEDKQTKLGDINANTRR